MLEKISDLKEKAINDFIDNYEANDTTQNFKNLLFLLILINGQYKNGEKYDHELKKLLFKSNCIHNPLGTKYTSDYHKKSMQLFNNIINTLKAVNDGNTNIEGVLQDGLTFDNGLIDDCIDILIYLEFFNHMKTINSKRIEENPITQKSFLEQLFTLFLFIEDQTRILKNNYMKYISPQGVTGLELSVSSEQAEFYKGVKSSVTDTFEAHLESANEIIRFLFYKHSKNLDTHIDFMNFNFTSVQPYNNSEFQKYMYIAHQRSILVKTEESIRYGYHTIMYSGKSEDDCRTYFSPIEGENEYRARILGIIRREYRIRTNTLISAENLKDLKKSIPIIEKLSNELLRAQPSTFNPLVLNGFSPDANTFIKAEKITNAKERLITAITKDYYFNINVNGIVIKDLICTYKFLNTLAEITVCASKKLVNPKDQNTFVKELCLIEISYLAAELSRIHGYSKDYSKKLIDRFIFHETSNKDDDIFAQPLVKVSKTQVLFCHSIIDQVNLDRAIERQFIRHNKPVSEIGHLFEKYFIDTLQRGYKNSSFDFNKKIIPNFNINTNKIEYIAFDGKQIEFDVVSTLGDYLILTELKSVLTSYDIYDLESRKNNIKEAIKQLHRRRDSVIYDWNTFKSISSINLPENPYDKEHIILIACTDAFDYTPLKYDNVFITDDSTYLKYFTNPYIEKMILSPDGSVVTENRKIWANNKPDINEFINYLTDPVTIHPHLDYIEKTYIPIPRMDKEDYCMAFEEYKLIEDPIKATILNK